MIRKNWHKANMRILLVGGAVRNTLLGLPVRDRDYLVLGATVEDFLAAHPGAKPVGKTFPVVIHQGQEFCFPRGETLEDDLRLRDFTINAMALDERGKLFCHPHALEDLRARVLRPCSPSSLADDPLRVFRAARLLCELPGFSAHPELLEAMRALGPEQLGQAYAERVGQEALKACATCRPGDFLRLLDRTGCLSPWLAELEGASGIPGGPPQYHDSSVLEHTARIMDRVAAMPEGDGLTVWMALCHDLGKVATPKDILPRHIGHEERGEALAEALGQRLRLTARHIRCGALAARWHMLAGRYPELRPATRVDLLLRLKARGALREVFRMSAADKNMPGQGHLPEALLDLDAILSVALPPHLRDQGEKSGQVLHQLQAKSVELRIRNSKSPE